MDPMPSRLGRFVVRGEIGRGGMGVVYLGADPTLDRAVALKVLPERFLNDPDHLARLEREARVLAALSHPNIAVIHSLEQDDAGGRFLVLEMIEGMSLAQVLRAGPLPIPKAIDTCLQIARALESAHARGIVHRDLKPDNVRITADGLVKVLDFGLAHRERPAASILPREADGPDAGADGAARGAEATDTVEVESDPDPMGGYLTGTPGYMSPEQVRGQPQDHRTDIFSFGCVLYECLAGVAAFPGATIADRVAAVLTSEPDPHRIPSGVPPEIPELLAQCLRKGRRERLSEIRDARIVLESSMGGSVPLATNVRPVSPTLRAANPHNIPRHLTGFIGREREIADVSQLVRTSPLVTLTGAGGCGKTRLAERVALAVLPEYPDGAWMIDLGPVSDPGQVATTALSALGLRDQPGRTALETLLTRFERASALVVLDNCEHLLESCAALAISLLRECPNVRLLVTSREALGVEGERPYRVPSLSVPELAVDDAAELRRSEAVALFVERARALKPAFTLTDETAPLVARICRRLDGIPLAIELAATRIRVLTVSQIDARLDDRFRLLTGGSRTALERHQTLRATIGWSYALLSDEEKGCLRRLSVFLGGCTLAAAAAVNGREEDELAILDLLTHLFDKSLVSIEEADDESRYRLLESVRQFAAEELDRSGEAGEVRNRHLTHFLAFAASASKEIRGPASLPWMRRIESDHENLLAAIRWAGDGAGRVEDGLRLCSSLSGYWQVRGHFAFGRAIVNEALARDGTPPDSVARAWATSDAGTFALLQSDYSAARSLFEESIERARRFGEPALVAFCLNSLGTVATYTGDLEAATSLYEEGLAMNREQGNRLGIATALGNLARIAMGSHDHLTSKRLYEESLSIYRELQDRRHVARILGNLAVLHRDLGEYDRARDLSREALSIQSEMENKLGIAELSCIFGLAAQASGHHDEARESFLGALPLHRELGNVQGEATALRCLGELALTRKDSTEATRRLTESLALCRKVGDRISTARVLMQLGHAAMLASDLEAARARFLEGLALIRDLRVRYGAVPAFLELAYFARARGDAQDSARFFGAAAACTPEGIAVIEHPEDKAERVSAEVALRHALGDRGFEDSWEAGRAEILGSASDPPWNPALERGIAWLQEGPPDVGSLPLTEGP